MKGKIAFEEHMAIPETTGETRDFAGESADFDQFTREILDLDDMRLDYMDQAGIELAILSLNAPGVQAILDTDEAVEVARKGNKTLAAAVDVIPIATRRFALPMQSPSAAAEELERCVKELGFMGAMVNGFTQRGDPDTAIYYDIPEYREFWQTVADLDVSFLFASQDAVAVSIQKYDGSSLVEILALGLYGSKPAPMHCALWLWTIRGCQKPKINNWSSREFIPYNLWRMDARMEFSPRGYRGKRPLDYFREHFYVTTSGNFRLNIALLSRKELGKDRIFFCSDYPFERMEDAASWFDNTEVITDEERIQIGRKNAIELFDLELD